MKTFLSVLYILAVTVSSEAFWVMNMSELFPVHMPRAPSTWAAVISLCFVFLSDSPCFSQKTFSSRNVSTLSTCRARSLPTFSQVRASCPQKRLEWMFDLTFCRSRRWKQFRSPCYLRGSSCQQMHIRTDRRGQVYLLDPDLVLPLGQRKLHERRWNGFCQILVQSWRSYPIP